MTMRAGTRGAADSPANARRLSPMTDWRSNLGQVMRRTEEKKQEKEATQMAHFVQGVLVPAFAELRQELEQHDREVSIRHTDSSATLIVRYRGEEEISYRVQGRMFPSGVLPFADVRCRERRGLRLITSESMFRTGKPTYTVVDVTKQEVIDNFLKHYLPLLERE
jgi:hypothetical protein